MVNEEHARQFANIIQDKPEHSWFWILGAGVSATVTQGTPEVLWTGLVEAGLKQAARLETFRPLAELHLQSLPQLSKTPELIWLMISTIESALTGVGCKRWIHRVLSDVVAKDPTLFERLGAFNWPVATTNFDELASQHFGAAKPLLALRATDSEITAWLRRGHSRVLHLHGHISEGAGMLFTQTDYERHLDHDRFSTVMNVVFRGRPVFVGCGGTLSDPNISRTLGVRSERVPSFAAEPIVLARADEFIDLSLPVKRLSYGTQWSDLPAFLETVYDYLNPGARACSSAKVEQPSADEAWVRAYCTAIAEDYAWLKLPDFRRGDRDVPIPLDDVYVALALDYRDSQERLEEARVAHHHDGPLEERVAQDPLPRRAGEARESQVEQFIDEVLRDHEMTVVLGDPGTGKTTLVSWIARQAAMSRLRGESEISVAAIRIDAEADGGAPAKMLGPAWLPVAVAMPRYAKVREELQVDRKRRLVRFLAMHVASRCETLGCVVSVEQAESVLSHFAAQGRLLVALDGLDETHQIQHREDIVAETEEFSRWLLGSSDVSHAVQLHARSTNRLIITSRLAGYKHAPFSVDVPHFQVRPMRLSSAERLMRNLFEATRRAQVGQFAANREGPSLDELERGLFAALRDPSLQVGALVATPVLASAVFALYVGDDGVLPRDRRQTYAKIVDLFTTREVRRAHVGADLEQATAELRRLFQVLAFEAFCAPDSTLIADAKLGQRLRDLAPSVQRRAESESGPSGFGLLVPKAPGAYGFIRRTFQEYLCAEYLTQTDQSFEELARLAGFATWREPTRLSLMIWSASRRQDSNPRALEDEVDILVRASRLSNGLRPIALAIAAVAESHDPSRSLTTLLARGAVRAFAEVRGTMARPPSDLVAALGSFVRQQDGAVALEQALESELLALCEGDTPSRQSRAAASAAFINELARFSTGLVRALILAEPHDPAAYGWPISCCLLRLLTPELKAEKDPKPNGKDDPSVQEHRRRQLERWIAEDHSHVPRVLSRIRASAPRAFFAREPKQLKQICRDPAWARLLATAFGGQRDYDLRAIHERYHGLASFLQMEDSRRNEVRNALPEAWRLLISREDLRKDFVYALAVYLDTTAGPRIRATHIPPLIRAEGFIFENSLWDGIEARLSGPAADACAQDPVLESAVLPHGGRLQDAAALQARKVQRRLEDAAFRGLHQLTKEAAQRAMTQLADDERQAMFLDSLCAVGARFSATDFIHKFEERSLGPAASKVLRRERGALSFVLFNDDRLYTAAVWADSRAPHDYGLLVDIAHARLLWSTGRSYFPLLPFAYRGANLREQMVDYLSIIERCPARLGPMLVGNLRHVSSNHRAVYAEMRDEVLSTASRLEDQNFLTAIEGMQSAESCWSRLAGSAATPWTLRGRTRLLPVLEETARGSEEEKLFAAARGLAGGLDRAQTLELLARRCACLKVADVVTAALATEGLSAADAATLRIRLLPLSPLAMRGAMFDQALASIAHSDVEDRVALLRGLAEHARWTDRPSPDLTSLAPHRRDAATSAYVQGRHGDVLAALIDDGPLRDDPFFASELFAPLVAHAKLADALSAGSATPTSDESSSSGRLLAAQAVLESGDKTRILDVVVELSVNSPPGLWALWRRAPDCVDRATWQEVNAVLAAAEAGVSPLTVPGLVAALASPHDALRCRARALVAPAGHDFQAKTPSAAGQGLPVLLAFSEQAHRRRAQPNLRVQIAWRLERFKLDDLELAQRVISAASEPRGRMLIKMLAFATNEVGSFLASAATEVDAETRASLLTFFARWAHQMHIHARARNSQKSPEDLVLPSLADRHAHEAALRHRMLLLQPRALVSAIAEVHSAPAAALDLLRDRYGTSLTDFFSARPVEVERVAALGGMYYARSDFDEERHEAYVSAARVVLESKEALRAIVELLFYLLEQGFEDNRPEHVRCECIITLAAAAEHKPATIAGALMRPLERRLLLAQAATDLNSFTGRRAALLLLGVVFATPGTQPLADEIHALMQAAYDVPSVMDAALYSARQIRGLSDLSLAQMLDVLHGESAACAALAGRMLVSIANSTEVEQTTRERIMDALNRFVEHPHSERTFHFGTLDVFSPPSMTVRDLILNEFEAGGEGVRAANR